MKQILPDTIPKHMKDENVIGNGQYGFINRISCGTNLIDFYNKVIGLMNGGRAVDVVDFS